MTQKKRNAFALCVFALFAILPIIGCSGSQNANTNPGSSTGGASSSSKTQQSTSGAPSLANPTPAGSGK